MRQLSNFAIRKPKVVIWLTTILSVILMALVALPMIAPDKVPFLNPMKIDTDPENMLSKDEPVRMFHNEAKAQFSLYNMIVLGVVDSGNPNGVFNSKTLSNVYELTNFIKEIPDVISVDLISPSTVDNIEQAGPGTVKFEWLMSSPPTTEAEAASIAQKAKAIPFLNGTLVSDDQKALAIYIPITSKDVSYKVAEQIKEKIATLDPEETYHITGLPIAQDQFGIEMFKQMAISAPMAMALIFGLMWLFFRNVKLISAPMLVSVVSVIFTMGLLIITGHTVHIMSSMIPIFIMPIAVLDAVHILSDFFDEYSKCRNRKETIQKVMKTLSMPMLYTSLTTSVGFVSLALTPIPPVRTFGIFVGLGVAAAWLFTITLIPAYVMVLPEKSLDGFGLDPEVCSLDEREHASWLARVLHKTSGFTTRYAKLILVAFAALFVVSYYGIHKIVINDNPVKWFHKDHEIRLADKALNERFAGTYMAYLSLSQPKAAVSPDVLKSTLVSEFENIAEPVRSEAIDMINGASSFSLKAILNAAYDRQDMAESDTAYDAWGNVVSKIESVSNATQIFKNPEVLRYIGQLQSYLLETGLVGKSNGLPDVVKTVHRELYSGSPDAFKIPDTQSGVAETLITFQNSHRAGDLWHFVTPDYQKTNLWIQLKSGDNIDMKKVVDAVEVFFNTNPPPIGIDHNWFGLTYINMIWQEKMVNGMRDSFLGSFVIVLVMMVVLFRSVFWGVLSMIPLTATILVMYGVIGFVGKDFDMPLAVLSSLSLGLAVDYSIHFISRARQLYAEFGNWKDASTALFAEPARAIARNVIVIGFGFVPLLFAPLVPYQTVGIFISSILVLAGVTTLILLPAIITLVKGWIFKGEKS